MTFSYIRDNRTANWFCFFLIRLIHLDFFGPWYYTWMMQRTHCVSKVLFILNLSLFSSRWYLLKNQWWIFLIFRLWIDQSSKLSIIFIDQIIMINHISKLIIVLANSLIFSKLISISNDLERFHIKVVFQWKMNIHFTSPYQQFFKFYVFQLLMKNKICAKFRYIELQILFGEDYWLALICNYTHELMIYLTIFSKEKGNENKEGIHYYAKGFVLS